MELGALFRLAFATAPELQFLNLAPYIKSPDHSSIGTLPSFQKEGLQPSVSLRFQIYFTPR